MRVLIGASLLFSLSNSANARMPMRLGECDITSITSIRSGFSNEPLFNSSGKYSGDGTAFEAKNGVSGVSGDLIAALGRSRIGDTIKTCLTYIPTGCPKNDQRGHRYKSTNLRTKESWDMQDSGQSCGK